MGWTRRSQSLRTEGKGSHRMLALGVSHYPFPCHDEGSEINPCATSSASLIFRQIFLTDLRLHINAPWALQSARRITRKRPQSFNRSNPIAFPITGVA